MTIPVVPGPWSWLDQAGQGVASVINARTARDLRERDEAKKHLAFIFEAVQKGALSTSALKSPAFLGLVHKSGLGDVIQPSDVAPNPEEQIKSGQAQFIQQMLGQSTPEIPDLASAVMGPGGAVGVTPAIQAPTGADAGTARRLLLSTGKIPTPGDVAAEQSRVPVSQLAGETATALLPGAKPTALAGQNVEGNKAYDDVAERVVLSYYDKFHKVPSPAQAAQYGQTSKEATGFGDFITEQHYGAAAARLQESLDKAATARIAASQRYGTASLQDDWIRAQTALTSQLTTQLNALLAHPPSTLDKVYAGVAARKRAAGKPLTPEETQAEQNVQAYETQVNDLRTRLGGLQSNTAEAARVQAPVPGGPTQRSAQDLAKQQQEWDAAAEWLRQHPEDKRQLPPRPR